MKYAFATSVARANAKTNMSEIVFFILLPPRPKLFDTPFANSDPKDAIIVPNVLIALPLWRLRIPTGGAIGYDEFRLFFTDGGEDFLSE
jgi:hypothetical protein